MIPEDDILTASLHQFGTITPTKCDRVSRFNISQSLVAGNLGALIVTDNELIVLHLADPVFKSTTDEHLSCVATTKAGLLFYAVQNVLSKSSEVREPFRGAKYPMKTEKIVAMQ